MARTYRRSESFLLARHGRRSAVRPQVRSGCAVFSVCFVLAIWAQARLRKLAADVGRDPASVALAFRVHRHGASAPAKADNGERFLFFGSNAEIIDDLRAMRELGVKAIDFNFAALTVDAMRRFHEEVVA